MFKPKPEKADQSADNLKRDFMKQKAPKEASPYELKSISSYVYSTLSILIIILAIPFSIGALYKSHDIGFMTLIYIQSEIVLDILISAQVVYNIVFSNTPPAVYENDCKFFNILIYFGIYS